METLEQYLEEQLKDEDFRKEYEKLKPRYEAIEQIIRARKEQNITQAELAKRVGAQKSNISRSCNEFRRMAQSLR